MNIKNYVLSFFLMMLTALVYSSIQAQHKNETHYANFSGEWKSKESISMGGNIVCSFNEGDRMLSKTMIISQQANFLTIDIQNPSSSLAFASRQEKLSFDGKENQINNGRERGKKFTVKFSADGQTMTINSIVHLMVPTPYNVGVQQKAFVYLKEVWTLGNDGKSVIVQANAKSGLFDEERSWMTVFDRVN